MKTAIGGRGGATLWAAIIMLLFGTSGNADVIYNVVDLKTLGGTANQAWSINDAGQIVGWSYLSDGHTRAFLYSGGSMSALGTLGGSYSDAHAINASGQITGSSLISDHGDFMSDMRVYIFSGGTMLPLGTYGSIFGDRGEDVNDNGHVVGTFGIPWTGGGTWRAVLCIGNERFMINSLGDNTGCGLAVNNSDQVVGYSGLIGGHEHAFLYDHEIGTIKDLGTLGGTDSAATDINELGQIVGWAKTPDNSQHVFLYSDGVMADLGNLGGLEAQGLAINDKGEIVGDFRTAGAHAQHAFLCADSGMSDLNDLIDPASGWVLTTARDINNAGQIVGWGTFNGNQRAFLLTAIPERATLALVALGGLALLHRRRGASS